MWQVQLGDSGDTITIPAGATITNNGTQTGFGRTGAVDWETTKKTASFTAVSGEGYFADTTSSALTNTTSFTKRYNCFYCRLWNSSTAYYNRKKQSNINGDASDLTISKANSGLTLVYVDATEGWKNTETSNLEDITLVPAYVTATQNNYNYW